MARIATSTSDTYTAGGRKDGALNMQILNSMGRKIRLEKISKGAYRLGVRVRS